MPVFKYLKLVMHRTTCIPPLLSHWLYYTDYSLWFIFYLIQNCCLGLLKVNVIAYRKGSTSILYNILLYNLTVILVSTNVVFGN